MWLVAFEQDNKWVFELFLVIGDTSFCKTYVVKFVVFLALLNFLGLLKSGGKNVFLKLKKKKN